MRVLKFGGSSLATSECIRGAVNIIISELRSGPVVVVVSALGGVTSELIAASKAAAARDRSFPERWRALTDRHRKGVDELARPEERVALMAEVEGACDDLKDLLHGAFLLRECSPRTRDSILSYGERLSATLVAAALRAAGVAAEVCDARRLVITDSTFGRAQVDVAASAPRIGQLMSEHRRAGVTPVVTGFIGATSAGETTTLGRGGSDYTATLVGAALESAAVELWTDVDGVMSADPRLVPGALPLEHITYAELMELSHFGAHVVYPPSVHPARLHGIPLIIRNTFRPDAEGTRVDENAPGSPQPIRGLASIARVALMRLEGDGMVGVPGISMRLFGALAREGVSVILISQASSEHSICFAVAPDEEEQARVAVEQEFSLERQAGLIDELVSEQDLSIVAAVGEEMRETPGISGRIFGILGARGINVRAIAQGSSELNISIVVAGEDEARAVQAIHDAFFSPHRRTVELAVVGTGRVGAALLEQLQEVSAGLASEHNPHLEVVALWNSRRMLLAREGIDLEMWRESLARGQPVDPARTAAFFEEATGSERVFVDCTASVEVPRLYARFLERGIAVVTANKRPFSGPFSAYQRLIEREANGKTRLMFETTVGAGLPILSTLANLIRCGDRVERIDGVLSGTLNFVLERMASGEPFSQALRQAHTEGLTEPHPGEDLAGTDVIRKLCILARQAGMQLKQEDVEARPLVAEGLPTSGDLPVFWQQAAELDRRLARLQERARERGCRLRYLAAVADGQARVGLEAVPPEHPCFDVRGADNLVAFTTARYSPNPLVIQGPGAGPDVTAAGLMADILRASESSGF